MIQKFKFIKQNFIIKYKLNLINNICFKLILVYYNISMKYIFIGNSNNYLKNINHRSDIIYFNNITHDELMLFIKFKLLSPNILAIGPTDEDTQPFFDSIGPYNDIAPIYYNGFIKLNNNNIFTEPSVKNTAFVITGFKMVIIDLDVSIQSRMNQYIKTNYINADILEFTDDEIYCWYSD